MLRRILPCLVIALACSSAIAKVATYNITNNTDQAIVVHASQHQTDNPVAVVETIESQNEKQISFDVEDGPFPSTFVELLADNGEKTIVRHISTCVRGYYYISKKKDRYEVLYNCVS